MKKLLAMLLMCCLACLPAMAEGPVTEPVQTPETAPAFAPDDMAQLLGMNGWELMEFFKGYEKDISRFDDGTTVHVGRVQIRVTVEGDDAAEDFDWRNGIVWDVCVMFDPQYSLLGYRVNDSYHATVDALLADGWTFALDESDKYRLMTNYDKEIDGVMYRIQLFTDDDIHGEPVNEILRLTALNGDTDE